MSEKDASAFLKSGIEYFEKGDYDRAITDTSESIRLNPNDALAYGTRGAAYKGKKDFDNAILDFSEAIRLDQNNAPAYGNRGLTYIAKNDKNQAVLDLEMAVKLDPQNAGYRKFLDDLKRASGDIKNNSSSVSTERVEAIKKEIKVIHIGAVIGAVIVFVLYFLGTGEPVGSIVLGLWVGVGIGGNLSLVVYFFIKGQTLFGFLDFGWWNSNSSFGLNIFLFFFRLFLGFMVADLGLCAFIIAGPVWPLIRIIKKKKQIKKWCLAPFFNLPKAKEGA